MLRDFAAVHCRFAHAGAIAVALVALPLAACGIKGPLKLPQPSASAPAAQPAAQPAEPTAAPSDDTAGRKP